MADGSPAGIVAIFQPFQNARLLSAPHAPRTRVPDVFMPFGHFSFTIDDIISSGALLRQMVS